jgi:hypothetical protein
VYSLPRLDSSATRTILRFMSLERGGAHPLAREPDLQLDTELSVNLLDVRADVIGDQIVLVLVDLRIQNPENDAIYLVDWKQGQMTLVSLHLRTVRVMQPKSARSHLILSFPRTRYTAPQTGHTRARSQYSRQI